MTTLQEALYLRAPAVVQHCLVSLKGLQLDRERKRGVYDGMRDRLSARRHWGREQFAQHQAAALGDLVSEARQHVPWYRRTLGDGSMAVLANWHKIPILLKESVRHAPHEFVDERFPEHDIIRLQTTGSTGTPVQICADRTARQINFAFFDDYLQSVGIDPRGRRAVLGGRVVLAPGQRQPPYWRRSLFQNALLMSAYHLSGQSAGAYLAALRRFRPHYIEAYPSAICSLAGFIGAGAGADLSLAGIVTSSETLSTEQREVIERAFGCPVFDQYGSAEMAQFVGQCTQGRYHVRPDYGLLEILDEDGAPVAPGEEGEVVCTGLINRVMPLIRYAIGDRAAWSAEECDCGLATPVLAHVSGRRDDLIRTPDGREVGRLSPVLKGFPIREAQYVQRTLHEVIVRVVPARELDTGTRAAIGEELRKRIGADMRIRVEEVAAIERGPGGKFRAVISELGTSRRPAGA